MLNPPPPPPPIPLNSIPNHKCTLGCPILDRPLKGGIPCGSITELVGECGVGKTQISLQLLLCAQLPISHGGLESSSIYIHTEGYFPSRRLQQLAQAFVQSGRLGQTRYTGNPSNLGKRKLQEAYDAEGNGKRIRGGSEWCKGDQDNEFWGAIDSAEWQVLDSLANPSRVPKICSELNHAHKLSSEFSAAPQTCIDIQKGFNDAPLGPRDDNDTHMVEIANENNFGTVPSDPCENIFVQSVQTIGELLDFLEHTQVLLSQRLSMPVRLLIIDSVAALFRSDFDNTAKDLTKRAGLFFKLSSKLKYYAQKFNLAVVVTNQVVDCVDSEGSKGSTGDLRLGNFESLVSSGRRVVPALGLSWAHCVNTRLFLSRTQEVAGLSGWNCESSDKGLSCNSSTLGRDGHDGFFTSASRRKLQVVFAPHLPGVSCDFVIEKEGVRGIP